MGVKISELPSATNLTGSEEIPIVQTGTTKKATANLIKPTIATSITSSSTNNEVAGAKAVYDFAQDNYSTTEQRIGTWIDGKPLYKITYQLTCPTDVGYGEVTQDLSSLNYESIVNLLGTTIILQTNNDKYWRALNTVYAYNTSSVQEFSGCWIKNNTLFYRFSGYGNKTSFKVYVTLLYTKTTNSAS